MKDITEVIEVPDIRRSQERANSKPPPNAAPSTTAIVGTGST